MLLRGVESGHRGQTRRRAETPPSATAPVWPLCTTSSRTCGPCDFSSRGPGFLACRRMITTEPPYRGSRSLFRHTVFRPLLGASPSPGQTGRHRTRPVRSHPRGQLSLGRRRTVLTPPNASVLKYDCGKFYKDKGLRWEGLTLSCAKVLWLT